MSSQKIWLFPLSYVPVHPQQKHSSIFLPPTQTVRHQPLIKRGTSANTHANTPKHQGFGAWGTSDRELHVLLSAKAPKRKTTLYQSCPTWAVFTYISSRLVNMGILEAPSLLCFVPVTSWSAKENWAGFISVTRRPLREAAQQVCPLRNAGSPQHLQVARSSCIFLIHTL